MQDLEVFKQIPGYKAILKAVLKNQIQSLVQQLAQQTGEESVLLTASLEEGTLTQLGSDYGKVFLEGHDEIKSQFLGFCLKRTQIQRQTKEFQESKPQKSWSSRRKQTTLPNVSRRSEPYPVSMTKVITGSTGVTSGSTKVRSGSLRAKSGSAKSLGGTVDQAQALDLKQKHKKAAQTTKAEATKSSTKVAGDGPVTTDPFTNNTHVTMVTTEGHGQEDTCMPEDDKHMQIICIESVRSEASVSDNSCNIYNNSAVSALIQSENQSAESSVSEDVSIENDLMIDETGQIDGNELDGCVSASEEVVNDTQGHWIQDQGQLESRQSKVEDESSFGIGIMQDVVTVKERPSRKSKLRLFNQNKRAAQKSLKERKAELENYLNLDNTDRPYPCNLCPKRFKERHHLVYHLRTHSGHRPYVCTICGKSFTQSSSLNTHKKLHLKDISCDLCGQVFRKISLLQNHVCKSLDLIPN